MWMMLHAILKAASAIFQIIPPQNTARSSLTKKKFLYRSFETILPKIK